MAQAKAGNITLELTQEEATAVLSILVRTDTEVDEAAGDGNNSLVNDIVIALQDAGVSDLGLPEIGFVE